MEDNELKNIEKKIIKQACESISYYDNCSYIKRKIEENMRNYNIIKFDKGRRKTLRPRKIKNMKSSDIIEFNEGCKRVLKRKAERNNEVDKNKKVNQKQNDDDILGL